MNKQHGKHMSGGEGGEPHGGGGAHKPHIHIHHAGGKTHVHIMHHDQPPEKHEHEEGDTEGIKAHIDQHYGGEEFGGQDMSHDGGGAQEPLI